MSWRLNGVLDKKEKEGVELITDKKVDEFDFWNLRRNGGEKSGNGWGVDLVVFLGQSKRKFYICIS